MEKERPYLPESSGEKETGSDETRSVEEIDRKMTANVIVAEDLACAKEELQDRIFNGNIPASEWHNAVDEYLEEHPNLVFYKPVMMDVIKRARASHDRIAQISAYYKRKNSETANDSQQTEEMREEIAKDMFKSIFEKDPLGKIEFVKGSIALTFIVDREDFDRIYTMKHAFPVDGTVMQWREIPLLLVLRNPKLPKNQVHANLSTMIHESEHAKNMGFRSAREWFSGSSLKHYLFLSELNGLDKKLRKLEKGNVRMEECAKDEILAFFTVVEHNDSAGRMEDEERNDMIQKNLNYIKKELCEDGGYLTGYINKFNPDEEEKKRYLENVNRGVDAIARLREFYKEQGIKRFDRRAMDVLEQFPLFRWPAVERLIEARHAEDKETDEQTEIGI